MSPLLCSARKQTRGCSPLAENRESGSGAIERRSLADRAADAIRELIVTGACAPGSRITEQQFAQQLGLSRGTIRAALRELVHEGLAEVRPYSGWSVVSLTPEDAAELSMLRGALEGLAARLAAETMNEKGRVTLDRAYDALKRAATTGDHRRLVAADMDLHKSIFRLAGSARLQDHYARIEPALRMYIALADRNPYTPQGIVDWHLSLVEAIRAGEGARAETIARSNAEKSGAELQAILQGLTPSGGEPERSGGAGGTERTSPSARPRTTKQKGSVR